MKNVVLISLLLTNLVYADCDKALGLCNSYAHSLEVENKDLKTEIGDLKYANSEIAQQLEKVEEAPLIPAWIWVVGGVVLGSVGTLLVVHH